MKTNQPNTQPLFCPFLGMQHDSATLYRYPSPANFCYHCRKPVSPLETHQMQYCLTPLCGDCPVFQQDASNPFPADLAEHATHTPSRKTMRIILWILVVLIAVQVIAGLVYTVMQGVEQSRQVQLTPSATLLMPTFTPTPEVTVSIPVTGGDVTYTQSAGKSNNTQVPESQVTTLPSRTGTGTVVLGTVTATGTATKTATKTVTATLTGTSSYTPTSTNTKTPTRTSTNTATATKTASKTATSSFTVSKTSTNTRTLTSTVTKTSTHTFTATSTNTRTFTPSMTASPRPTSTPTPRPHSLETEFKVDGKTYLIHMVTSGENYEIIARNYKTTVEVLLSLNYQAPAPLWVKSTLLISPGMQTVDSALPIFQTYQVIEKTTSVEALAQKYSVDLNLMRQYNSCPPNCDLNFGDWALIPRPR